MRFVLSFAALAAISCQPALAAREEVEGPGGVLSYGGGGGSFGLGGPVAPHIMPAHHYGTSGTGAWRPMDVGALEDGLPPMLDLKNGPFAKDFKDRKPTKEDLETLQELFPEYFRASAGTKATGKFKPKQPLDLTIIATHQGPGSAKPKVLAKSRHLLFIPRADKYDPATLKEPTGDGVRNPIQAPTQWLKPGVQWGKEEGGSARVPSILDYFGGGGTGKDLFKPEEDRSFSGYGSGDGWADSDDDDDDDDDSKDQAGRSGHYKYVPLPDQDAVPQMDEEKEAGSEDDDNVYSSDSEDSLSSEETEAPEEFDCTTHCTPRYVHSSGGHKHEEGCRPNIGRNRPGPSYTNWKRWCRACPKDECGAQDHEAAPLLHRGPVAVATEED